MMYQPSDGSNVKFLKKEFHFNGYHEICLIDDNPSYLYLHDLLIEMFYPFPKRFKFSDISEAYNHISKYPAHKRLVFLDLHLGLNSGFELLDKLSEDTYHHTEVIILSDSENPEDIEQAKTYSFVVAYIEKPLSSIVFKKIAAPSVWEKNYRRIRQLFGK